MYITSQLLMLRGISAMYSYYHTLSAKSSLFCYLITGCVPHYSVRSEQQDKDVSIPVFCFSLALERLTNGRFTPYFVVRGYFTAFRVFWITPSARAPSKKRSTWHAAYHYLSLHSA